MYRTKRFFIKSLAGAAVLGLSAYGLAFADDNSMSMWTGDSYAQFNNLDYSAGRFNMARSGAPDSMIAKAPAAAQAKDGHAAMAAHRLTKGTPTTPFRNDTGA